MGNRSDGYFGTVVDKQPASRPIVFSENLSDSVLNTMAQQKAELIRAEKNIAKSLSEQQKHTEIEVSGELL